MTACVHVVTPSRKQINTAQGKGTAVSVELILIPLTIVISFVLCATFAFTVFCVLHVMLYEASSKQAFV